MPSIFYILVPIALAAVAAVLLMGVFNMARGGPPQRSQNLMRMRIVFQLIAVVIVMAAVYFTPHP